MKAAALYLLLLINYVNPGRAQVSLSVRPKKTQFFKYDRFSISCDEEEQSKEKEKTGWKVKKMTVDGEVHQCPSICNITAAYPFTDSGVYWCESGHGATSSNINITVTAGNVILEGPVHPVMEGNEMSLRCTSKLSGSACKHNVNFYKDGRLIHKSTTGNMTVRNVSKSDEGLYKCVCGSQESPQSWLIVRASPSQAADHHPPAPQLSVFTVLRHLLVGSPYLLSTIMLGLIYRDRARVRRVKKARRSYNDVIMEVTA